MLNSYQVKYYNSNTGIFIIRIARDNCRILWSAITLMNKITFNKSDQYIPCSIIIKHCAGTIRSCQKFLLTFLKEHINEYIASNASNMIENINQLTS